MGVVLRFLLAVSTMAVIPVMAQDRVVRGVVQSVQSRYETNEYGDDLIVSRLVLDTGDIVDMVGGTLDGVTLEVSETPIPGRGRAATFRVDSAGRATGVVVEGYLLQGWSWPVSDLPVPYYVNPSTPDLSAAAVVAAMGVGAQAWHQSGSSFRWLYAGTTSGSSLALNYKNEVFFRNTSNSSLIAETYKRVSGSRIVDFDVILYDATYRFFTGTSGCSRGIYVEDIMAHEFGHGLGLGHSLISAATMYATLGWCSQKARSLYSDDIAGLTSLYPASTVPDEEPASITLAAKVPSVRFRINWAGASGTYIEVHIDGVFYLKTANDGAQTITLTGKGPGPFQVKVCEIGGSPCSPTVTVSL